MNTKLKIATASQTVLWLGGMGINYLLDGTVLVGSLLGVALGLVIALIVNLKN